MLLYGSAIALTLGVSARAADINVYPWGDLQALGVENEILPGDFEAFKLKASPLVGKVIVVLRSPGGSLIDAMEIGEFVRLRGWVTFVYGECDSACAAIWLAGTPRIMMSNALIGFHAASINGQERGQGNAVFGAYMTRLGLGYPAVGWATTAGPNDIAYLTPDKAKEIDISVNVIPYQEKQAAVQPAVPPPIPQPPTVNTRDCSAIGVELLEFFPDKFGDCSKPPARVVDFHIHNAAWRTVKSWDRYVSSTGRYVARTLQTSISARIVNCGDGGCGPYRLIAKDHDAEGGSNGGSVCFFEKDWSDCETNEGQHYKLGAGSIKSFLSIANGADAGPVIPNPAPVKPAPTKRKIAATPKTVESCDVCNGGGRTCQPCYWEKHPPVCEYGRQPGSIYCNRFPAGDPRNNE
jgi:hypothetical protein